MNAPFALPSPAEMVNARQLIESKVALIQSCERELMRCDAKSDPDGDRGALLGRRILSAQGIVAHQVKTLTGLPVEALAKALGL